MLDFYKALKVYQIPRKEKIKLYWRWRLLQCRESKTKLIMSFMPMALKIATKIAERVKLVEIDDLFQESYLIIDELIDRYNPQKAELSTYIYNVLRGRLKELCATYILPVKMSQKKRRLWKELGISFNPVYLSELLERREKEGKR